MKSEMTLEEHRQRHVKLHQSLDELLGDWITQTGNLPSKHTVMELLEWSHQQTINPTTERQDKEAYQDVQR